MSVIIILLFVAIAIGISAWRKRTATVPEAESVKAKLSSVWKGLFVHPGHSWVEVFEPSLVAVGADEFTKSVFGSVERLTLPEPGSMIQQGGKAWGLKRGKRHLVQTAPISGRVVEVNQALVDNPKLLTEKDPHKNWILKVQPTGLSRQLQNLISGGTLSRWNQAVKEQLAAVLGPAEFPVLQDGGEIALDLGDRLTDQQWDKVAKEFFTTTQNR
jgi:glycine cleavage system H lipoate-binding protein